MPVRHSVIHKIDKKPDGSPAVVHLGGAEQVESQASAIRPLSDVNSVCI